MEDEEQVQAFLEQAVAPSTERAYSAAFRKWQEYAAERGFQELPARSEQVMCFLAARGRDVSWGAAQTAAAAINNRHVRAGFQSPTNDPTLRMMLAGVRRQSAHPPTQAAPMTRAILDDVIRVIERDRTNLVIWRTAWRMSMEFYGFLRWQEVSSLQWADIKFSGAIMELKIRKSKTDQLCRGQVVTITGHREETLLCPIFLTKQYARQLRYGPEKKEASMQPRMTAGGGPRSATKISYDTAVTDLRNLMEKAGHSSAGFTEHSGRRGGATAAAEAGVGVFSLTDHGRWKSLTSAQKYVDKANTLAGAVGAALAEGGRSRPDDAGERRPPQQSQGSGPGEARTTEEPQQRRAGPAATRPIVPETTRREEGATGPGRRAASAAEEATAAEPPQTRTEARRMSAAVAAERARLLAAGFTESWADPDRITLYPPGWRPEAGPSGSPSSAAGRQN